MLGQHSCLNPFGSVEEAVYSATAHASQTWFWETTVREGSDRSRSYEPRVARNAPPLKHCAINCSLFNGGRPAGSVPQLLLRPS